MDIKISNEDAHDHGSLHCGLVKAWYNKPMEASHMFHFRKHNTTASSHKQHMHEQNK